MAMDFKNFLQGMKNLISQAEGGESVDKKPMEKIQRPMPHTHPVPKDTKKQGESTMGSQVRTAKVNESFKPGAGKSSMDGAKDAAKQSLSDTKSMPKPNLPKSEGANAKPKLGKGTPKTDDETSKPLPEGEMPSNEKPFEDPSPENQADDSVPAGEEAPASEEPQLEDQVSADVDQDGAPDDQEDHGAIDPEQSDLNGDGQVTHDEAEQAAPGSDEQQDDDDAQMNGEQDSEYMYIAGDGDSIGAQVGQAMLHDDVEGLHAVSSKINQGQDAFQQWLQSIGGEMISAGGDEFVARVPAGADLNGIEEFRNQYNQTVGATVTIGLGSSMSQAGKALIYGKLNGKDQVAQYDESMEQFLQGIQSGDHSDPMSEEAKQKDHYLNSVYDSEGMDDTSANPEAAVEQVADGQVPMEEQPMNEDIGKDDGAEVENPEDVNAFESVMADGMTAGDGSYLKEQMMNVLDGFKKDKEFIESMKSTEPEVYAEIIGLLHQMIKTSKMLNAARQQPILGVPSGLFSIFLLGIPLAFNSVFSKVKIFFKLSLSSALAELPCSKGITLYLWPFLLILGLFLNRSSTMEPACFPSSIHRALSSSSTTHKPLDISL